ncbi:AMP-binding protein [Streptomyces celluloflavus]|uniref:AMP-binding protein n=1 Tax=Streptomyces celluloflavus TaxID=58344 RepID=UPI003655825A
MRTHGDLMADRLKMERSRNGHDVDPVDPVGSVDLARSGIRTRESRRERKSVDSSKIPNYVEENLDVWGAVPDRVVLVHGERRITGEALRNLIYKMARALRNQGVCRGRTVTLLCGNGPEGIAAGYAAGLLGCRVSHLDSTLSAKAQADIVEFLETSALIVDPRCADQAAAVMERTPVRVVFTLGPASMGTDLLELAARESAGAFGGLTKAHDVCLIRQTGGTTGVSKAVLRTFADTACFRDLLPREREPHVQLVCSTLAHGVGMLADHVLRDGGTLVLLESFDAATVLSTIERERITYLSLIPPLLYQLLDHPDLGRTDLSSLRCIYYGGCTVSPARLAEAVARFGPVLEQFYGLTEAGPISSLPPEDHDPAHPERLASAGKVRNGVEVVIRDAKGRDLPPGQRGEICVRSPFIMRGYWKRPDLTAEVLRDGWLHTGDIGYLDSGGYLTVTGRSNDLIKAVEAESAVSAVEMERILDAHPHIRQSAVFSVWDRDNLERIHAAVVLEPGRSAVTGELRTMVHDALGEQYDLADVMYVDALPLTGAGKPDKERLRRRASTAYFGPGPTSR